MMKHIEEWFETMEQEIASMKIDLQRLSELEAKMTKHMEKIDVQNELNTQQQQNFLKYIESMMKDPSSSTSESEKASSKMKAKVYESNEEPNSSEKEESDKNSVRSKFKKVEMPVFNGEDLDSWLFRGNWYFQIHKLIDSEKMTVATISFDGPALNWYRAQEEREKFTGWSNLKERLLVRFRSAREGSICGQFLRIR